MPKNLMINFEIGFHCFNLIIQMIRLPTLCMPYKSTSFFSRSLITNPTSIKRCSNLCYVVLEFAEKKVHKDFAAGNKT